MPEPSQTYEIFIEVSTRLEFTLFGIEMNPGPGRFRELLEGAILEYFEPLQKCRSSVYFVEDGLSGVRFYDYEVGDRYKGRLSVRAM